MRGKLFVSYFKLLCMDFDHIHTHGIPQLVSIHFNFYVTLRLDNIDMEILILKIAELERGNFKDLSGNSGSTQNDLI